MPSPQEESKVVEEPTTSLNPADESEDEAPEGAAEASTSAAAGKKKKSKKKSKGKKATTGETGNPLPKNVVDDILKHNPALASEFQGMDRSKIEELMRGLKLQEVATGLVSAPATAG